MLAVILKWTIILLAVLNFGYMLFDGSGALIKGDYIRPTRGEYAGQLGPWSKLVKAIGIKPRIYYHESIVCPLGNSRIDHCLFLCAECRLGEKRPDRHEYAIAQIVLLLIRG